MKYKLVIKKTRIKMFLIMCFIFSNIFSQESKSVKGVVTELNGVPLFGVNVLVKGTKLGVLTDFDGVYELTQVPKNAVLVFSYVGFETKEVALEEQSVLNIVMKENVNTLDEVVVVGYGTVDKKDLTGAVSTVEVDEIVAQQSNTVDKLLQGRVAGVDVIQNNGAPGSGVSVRIRGASSLRGNNEPLYVVDGVIIASAGEDVENPGDSNTLQENQNGLNGINPRDIESMQVLKDASATAIYGSRGANGVVIITTKKGTRGKVKIDGYLNTSVTSVDKTINVLSAVEYAEYRNESSDFPLYHISDGEVYQIFNADTDPVISEKALTQHNWQDELYTQGFSKSFGASFSGGSDNGNYYVSTGYNDQAGVVKNSRFQSGNFSVNLVQDLTSKLKLDTRFSSFYAVGSFAQDGHRVGGGGSFINNVLRFNPLTGGVGDDFNDDQIQAASPLSWIEDYEDLSEESRFRASLKLTYKFNESLSYRFSAGGDLRDKERRRFYGPTTSTGRTSNGQLSISSLNSKSYQINNLLTYKKTFNKKHRLNAVAGVTYDVREVRNTLYQITDFSTFSFGADLPSYGQNVTYPYTEIPTKTQLLSFLSRVNYTLDYKYIFTGTVRSDGSSKFSKANRYKAFPSFAFGWRVNNENFLKNSKVVNNLKLRAGWGQTGNQAIKPYQTFTNYSSVLYGSTGNGTEIGFAPVNIGNPDLIWETTTQINIGLDFGFLNDRLFGNVDLYSKQTDDLLQLEKLPTSTGFRQLLINRGSLEGKGLEFTLSGIVVDKKDFKFEIGGNIAFNRSKILNLGIPESGVYLDGSLQQRSFYLGDNIANGKYFNFPANIFIEGEQVGLFYGFKTDGIYQTDDVINVEGAVPGDVRIIDINEDGKIDAFDRTVIGNPNPDFIFGGYIDMSYKRFNLNVLLNGTHGNEIVNGTNLSIDYAEGIFSNIRKEPYEQAWRSDAPSNTYPRIGYSWADKVALNDRQVEDGSFLRVKNITLGYDVPVVNSNTFNRINIFLSGTNLFTFTKYRGYNPEITNFLNNGNILGVDWLGAPNARSISLGANLSF